MSRSIPSGVGRCRAFDIACVGTYDCTSAPLGELWYTALGHVRFQHLSNTGPFKNLDSFFYWTATDAPAFPNSAYGFSPNGGYFGIYLNP